jgi:hypothetical protein
MLDFIYFPYLGNAVYSNPAFPVFVKPEALSN